LFGGDHNGERGQRALQFVASGPADPGDELDPDGEGKDHFVSVEKAVEHRGSRVAGPTAQR
jgi:hypothetical protein